MSAPARPRRRLLAPHKRHSFGDYYDVGRKLGEGSFGDVHEAFTKPVDPFTGQPAQRPEGDVAGGGEPCEPQRKVAVKIFRLGSPDQDANNASTGLNDSHKRKHDGLKKTASFEAERLMLAGLEHPHIVRMHECFQEASSLFIVLELCSGGELYSRLVAKAREAGTGLDEPLSQHLFRQMLFAVGYLHTLQIVHRDIKTENFLLLGKVNTPEGDTLKLCDFGTSACLSQAKPRCMDNIGTLSYTAPEVYMNQGAAIPSDAWSLGVVLYVILTGTNPFRMPGRKLDREETVRRIRAGEFEQNRMSWLHLSSAARDLVRQFLVLEEQQRITCHEALQHRWLVPEIEPTGNVALAEHAPRVAALLLRLPRMALAQRLAVECCALAASEEDVRSEVPWRELFMALDADQDGRLSYQELTKGLLALAETGNGLSIPTEHLEDCVRALDLDGSGAIEWVEWLVLALLGAQGFADTNEPLSTAFRLADGPPDLGGDGTGGGGDCIPESEETVSEVITKWTVGKGRDTAAAESLSAPRAGFTMQELRCVLSSLELSELL